MAKSPVILTDGAITDFVEMLPDRELQARVKKTIMDFYHPERPARTRGPAAIGKKGGAKKRQPAPARRA